MKRIAVILVVVIGIVLFAFPFVTGLFGKTSSVEKLTGDFRNTFTDKSLQQTRDDFDGVKAMADQLTGQTLPALPGLLDMKPNEFNSAVATNFPAVNTGLQQLPRILPRLETLVSALQAEQSDFKKADAIPFSFLPSTIVPPVLLVVGALLVLLAGGVLGGKVPAPTAVFGTIAVGVILVALALFSQIYSKGEAVDNITAKLKPFFTADGAAQTRTDLDTVTAMTDELQTKTLPFLATKLNVSATELNATIAKNWPDVSNGLAALPAVLPRFDADVTAISHNVKSFKDVSEIPLASEPTTSLLWWLVVPGIALIVLGFVVGWPAKKS